MHYLSSTITYSNEGNPDFFIWPNNPRIGSCTCWIYTKGNSPDQKNIFDQLNQVDSLQQVYIKVLADESQLKKSEISLGEGGFSLSSDKTNTKEYELLNKEIELRDKLRRLEERKVNEDVFFEIISSFQKVGKKTSKWYTNFLLIFPAITFIVLCIVYLIRKLVKYVVQYEA